MVYQMIEGVDAVDKDKGDVEVGGQNVLHCKQRDLDRTFLGSLERQIDTRISLRITSK